MNAMEEVFEVIKDRKANPKEESYVCSLFNKGEDKILEKVGEEATELIIASKGSDRKAVVHEATDLIFHVLILLGCKGVELQEIYEEFRRRKR